MSGLKNLYCAVYIEYVYFAEKMILNILHLYFQKYPDDYFWSDNDWYYTKNKRPELVRALILH
ncbi:MAG: hypothetical protein Q4F95_12760 [Oscillospiraceae bacterium]|nr:hypothetical protein [Oscillospiraceae bacterium]